MTVKPIPADAIQTLVSYRPNFGKKISKSMIRLSVNENGIGCSPLVEEAIKKNDIKFYRYPAQQDEDLIESIALRFKLKPEKILIGNGSDELIYLLCTAFLNPGDEAIHTEYGFLVFPQAIKIAGGVPIVAPDDNFTVSVDAIISKLTSKTKMVFLANPNNPTGSMISDQELTRLIDSIPKSVLLVLDWAYYEYVTSGLSDAAKLVESNNNVVMLRTFSKLFGIAALRLGWGYCPPDILATLQSIRGPFSVNQIAALAGRVALEDIAFQEKSVAHNKFWMNEIVNRFNEMGVKTLEGQANFMLLDFRNKNGPSAAYIANHLMEQGIQLRDMTPYGLPEMLRMSIGRTDEMEKFTLCLRKILLQEAS